MILQGVSFFDTKVWISQRNRNRFENTLACLSGAQVSLKDEKNWGSKISLDCPFNGLLGEGAGIATTFFFSPSAVTAGLPFQSQLTSSHLSFTRCSGHRWVMLHAVRDSAESCFTLAGTMMSHESCFILAGTVLSHATRCPGQHWVLQHAVPDSAESS